MKALFINDVTGWGECWSESVMAWSRKGVGAKSIVIDTGTDSGYRTMSAKKKIPKHKHWDCSSIKPCSYLLIWCLIETKRPWVSRSVFEVRDFYGSKIISWPSNLKDDWKSIIRNDYFNEVPQRWHRDMGQGRTENIRRTKSVNSHDPNIHSQNVHDPTDIVEHSLKCSESKLHN